MSVKTPCKVCGMCEYGHGCEDTPKQDRNPLCFYQLMDLEDRLVEHSGLSDDEIDTITGIVTRWLRQT